MQRPLIDSCHVLFLREGNCLRFESAELEVKRHCEEYLGVGLGHQEKGKYGAAIATPFDICLLCAVPCSAIV